MTERTVFIADDDAVFVKLLTARCEALGVRVATAGDGWNTMMAVLREPPDLLILDIGMPAGDGLRVWEKLADDPALPGLPVVFCTGRSDEATVARCRSLGAEHVAKGADMWPRLEAIIGRRLRTSGAAVDAEPVQPAADRPRLLFVDDDADLRRVMQVRLRACGIDVQTAASASQALQQASREAPDIVITDYLMPDGAGDYLMGRLKGMPSLRKVPVVVISGVDKGRRNYALERQFLGQIGAVAYFTKPVDFDQLIECLARYIAIDPEIRRQAARLRRR